MIKGDFFPTNITEANTGNELTAQIQALNISAFSEAYWLGWIKYDNIPSIYHLSEFSITDTSYVFTDVTKPKNYNVGYLSTYNDQLRNNNAILYPENPVTVASSPDYARYINRLDVMSTGIGNTFQIDFRVAMYQGSSGTWRDDGFPINTMEDMLAYLNGESDVTITFANQSYYTVTKTFKLTDMTDGALEWTDGSTQYVVTILGFHFGTGIRSISENQAYGEYISPTPCIDIETDQHRFISAPAIGPFTRANFQTSFRWNDNTWLDSNYKSAVYQFGNYDYYCSGLSGTIPKTFSTEMNHYGIFGNMLVFNDYPNYCFRITRIYTVDDIKHFMGLQIRIISVNTSPYTGSFYGYAEDDGVNSIGVYAPLVTEDNEFTTDLITGNLSDDTFKSQLRDWQYDQDEWENNDYEEGHWPEPDDEDQTGGVDWNPNTVFAVDSLDGFVTMYALRADQISRFGQYLWAEMWSDDFLNSIGVIFNQNLSLNPSEILNYIVSVRCYPFSVSGMAGAAPVPDTIYLGRGAEGIALNSGFDILRLSSYSEDIDGGTATIPKYYGDFRDYEPCSKITVFVPFCGSLELAPSQAVGNKIHLRYCVDFSSGAIQATVSIEGAKNNYIAGILTGTVGATVELSASNLSQVIQKVGGLAFNVAKTAVMFEVGGAALEGAETLEEGSKALAPFAASAAETISSVADMSTGVPTTLGTTAGFSAFQVTTPIVRIERRHYEIPDNYAHVYGYACNYTVKLEALKDKGYTVCKNVDLSGIPATQDELSAIESLLQSGVYF